MVVSSLCCPISGMQSPVYGNLYRLKIELVPGFGEADSILPPHCPSGSWKGQDTGSRSRSWEEMSIPHPGVTAGVGWVGY